MPVSKVSAMEVTNPKRILLVGPPDSGLLDLLTGLTGSSPTPPTTTPSLAGLSHAISLSTPYYSATVPIWLDELPLPPSSPSSWAADFLLPEAREVLSALGSVVLVFRKPSTSTEFSQIKELMAAVGKVVKEGLNGGIGGNWEGVALAVAWKRRVVPGVEVSGEEWEDLCMDAGFEFVDAEADVGKVDGERNEYGEKTGIPRLREALEANDWAGDDDELDLDGLGIDSDDEDGGFSAEATELEMEMFGMKRAIYEGGDVGEEFKKTDGEEGTEDGVDGLEGLMMRMQGIRDMGADMPEAERKRFAAKAVRDIMKTL